MKMFKPGAKVRRIAGGQGFYGNEGTVVEADPNTRRLKVRWTHRAKYYYNPEGKVYYTDELIEIRDPLETWVRQTACIELVDTNMSSMV